MSNKNSKKKDEHNQELPMDDFQSDGSEIKFESSDEDVVEINSAKSSDLSASELKKATEEAEKYKKDYLYLMAEFDNYKKQAIKERSQLVKYGNERLLVALLDVLDNFERALEVELTTDTIESFKQGIELTQKELLSLVKQFGVEPIDSVGVPFDPSVHEALSSQESTDVPPGHILTAFKKAYKLHDRVIRPAQVIVAQEPKK